MTVACDVRGERTAKVQAGFQDRRVDSKTFFFFFLCQKRQRMKWVRPCDSQPLATKRFGAAIPGISAKWRRAISETYGGSNSCGQSSLVVICHPCGQSSQVDICHPYGQSSQVARCHPYGQAHLVVICHPYGQAPLVVILSPTTESVRVAGQDKRPLPAAKAGRRRYVFGRSKRRRYLTPPMLIRLVLISSRKARHHNCVLVALGGRQLTP
jgi:hypothetical protein